MICYETIKKFCNGDITQIENYEQAMNDTTQTWHCHHRLETDLNLSAQELIDRDLYYNRPTSELIFLTKSEHSRLHSIGRTYSEKTRKKLSIAHKDKHLSEETKLKMSKAKKGIQISDEHRQNIGKARKGKHHSEEAKQKISEAQRGKNISEETKLKLSESHKGKHWKLINGKHVYY